MRSAWPALLLLSGCAGLAAGPERPYFDSVERTFDCPDPRKRGRKVVRADGTAQLTIWEGGYGAASPAREMRHRKRLKPEEVRELSRFLERSGYETIPEKGRELPMGQAVCLDCCDGSLTVRTAAGEKRISWRGEDGRPAILDAVLAGIDSVVERAPWEPDLDWVRPGQ